MFCLENARVKLVNANAKPELHGDDHVTAIYLKFEFKTANTILNDFDPLLLPALFRREADGNQETLIENYLPERKFSLLAPLEYGWEGAGYTVTVEFGATGKDIVLPMADIDKIVFELFDGGSVSIRFRVIAHPDALNIGRLIEMQQQEVVISLEPPSADGMQ